MKEKIEKWLADGGELFVVQDGEGGTKVTDYAQLEGLVKPNHGDGLVEAIIIEKDGKSEKSTSIEQNLDATLAEIGRLIDLF